MLVATDLPRPDADALAHSARVSEHLRRAIADAGGWLDFERFMDLVLYAPGLGYYSAGSQKFGVEGDFVTAPELGGAFAQLVAPFVATQLEQLNEPAILELGPGSGALAEGLMTSLAAVGQRPRYALLETSAELKARQRERLAPYADQAVWLEVPPQAHFEAIVIANEVVDALPVRRFELGDDGNPRPLGVCLKSDQLAIEAGEPDEELTGAWREIANALPHSLPKGFVGELRPRMGAWLESVVGQLDKGGALFIDYGLDQASYYHPADREGRLACFYRHRIHNDPTYLPGLCDITASVDFSALARAATALEFRIAGYTTQAQFLAAHLDRLTGSVAASASQLRTLLLPAEMGERFKVLWATAGLEPQPFPGRDMRGRL